VYAVNVNALLFDFLVPSCYYQYEKQKHINLLTIVTNMLPIFGYRMEILEHRKWIDNTMRPDNSRVTDD
jgi:hypothetical protein